MKIYRIDYHDDQDGHCLRWAATPADSRAIVAELKALGFEASVERIEMAPRADELALYLDTHFTRDNG